MNPICICLLVFVITFPIFSVQSGDETLELVHVIFRHGHRTFEKKLFYPKDPHINVTFYPHGYGLLTNEGKRKAYMLGKELRRRYKNFLEPFSIDTVDACSTNVARTKMSLQLVLASLFPPEKDLVWDKSLRWQPIPASYLPTKDDHILGSPYHNCQRYKQIYWKFLQSNEGIKMYRNYTDVMKYVAEHTGLNITSRGLFDLYFVLTMEVENGLQLPDWTKSVYPDALKKMVYLEYYARIATPELIKLGSGFLLKKIIADTKQKINGTLPENRKMFLYSGHEFNIISLMKLLGVYTLHIPPYGAYILIEIHNIKGVRNVKVFYQDYQSKNPRKLKLPDCHGFCKFKRFVQLYRKYLPSSKSECKI